MKKYQRLYAEGLLSTKTYNRIARLRAAPVFSLHQELRVTLYLGITGLSTGLGMLVYQHLDQLSHELIVAAVTALTAACLGYAFSTQPSFRRIQIHSTGFLADTVLLLGCLSLLSLLAYLHFRYTLFGTHTGLATFIPAVILFYLAYRFDHQGILGLAITNLALWMGIGLDPQVFLGMKPLLQSPLVWTAFLLGSLLWLIAYTSRRQDLKAHFSTVYQHFSTHISFGTLFSAYLSSAANTTPFRGLYLLLVIILALCIYRYAFKDCSFYLILIQLSYAYTASSLLYRDGLKWIDPGNHPYLLICWYLVSAPMLARHIYRLNQKIK